MDPARTDSIPGPDVPLASPNQDTLGSALPPDAAGAKEKLLTSRAAAYFIDFVLLQVLPLAGAFVGASLVGLVLADAGRVISSISSTKTWLENTLVLSTALHMLYFPVFEWLYGATPGKLILGLRVAHEDGKLPGLWPAMVRAAFRLVEGLFFGGPGIQAINKSPLGQRLGDRYAHTIVVRKSDPVLAPQRSWGWFALASALAMAMMSAFTTLVLAQHWTIASTRTAVPAAELNLQLQDLGKGFALVGAEGKESFEVRSLNDASSRLFRNDDLYLQTWVLTYNVTLRSTPEELLAAAETELRELFPGPELTLTPGDPVEVGDTGVTRRIVDATTGTEGYMLMFVERNVFARLTSIGPASSMTQDEMVRLARIISGRIR